MEFRSLRTLRFSPYSIVGETDMILKNAITLIVCVAVCVSSSESRQPQSRAQQEQIAAFLTAEEPEDIARSYHDLFIKASQDELCSFLACPDNRVALAAGWERVRRTIPKVLDEDAEGEPEKTALSRFLGLAEGRLQMSLPPFWEAALRGTNSNGRDNIWFAFPKGAAWPNSHGDDAWKNRRVELRHQDDRCVVTVGDRTWTLPCESYMRDAFVELAGDTVFVALYEETACQYRLHAINEKSGQARWEADVWAGTVPTGGTGLSWHNVEVRVHGNEVVVFGVSDNAAYVETFDVKTGKSLCRFGTGYFEFDEPAEQSSETSESQPGP